MNRVVPVAAALLAVFLPVFQASAEESENAARLHAVTETFLRTMLAASHSGDPGHEFDYRIEMTEHSDGAIVAAIRDLVVHESDGLRMVVDDVFVTYSPLDELRYTASMDDIPSMSFFDTDGAELINVTAARWHAVCVMRIDLALCEKSEIDAADLVLTATLYENEEPVLARLDRFSSASSLDETAARSWSGNSDIAFAGFSVVGDGVTFFSVGEARLTGEFRGAHEMLLSHQTQDTEISPETLWRDWLENLTGEPDERLLPIDHVSGSYTLSDLTWDDGLGSWLTVDSTHLELSMTALNGNEGAVRLRHRHDGLDVNEVPVMNVDPVPTDLTLDLDLEALPVREFMRIVIEQSEADPMDAGKPDPGMMISLLAEAGSTLQIELDYSAPALVASGTGHFTAVQKEPIPATGEADLVLTGLPDLVRQVRDDAMFGNEAAGFLALWQAIGRKEETSDGLRHHYDLELLPDGQILLNGNDLDVLFDLLGQN